MRLSAIGDVTHVVPVVRAIRNHNPDARITWIIGKLERRLLDGGQVSHRAERVGDQGLVAAERLGHGAPPVRPTPQVPIRMPCSMP